MFKDDGLLGCRNCHDGYIFVIKGNKEFVFRCSSCNLIEENGIPSDNRYSLTSKGYKLHWIHKEPYRANIPKDIYLAKLGINEEVPF
jgi:hypothetical protein